MPSPSNFNLALSFLRPGILVNVPVHAPSVSILFVVLTSEVFVPRGNIDKENWGVALEPSFPRTTNEIDVSENETAEDTAEDTAEETAYVRTNKNKQAGKQAN